MTRTTTKPMTAMSVALLPRAGGGVAAAFAGPSAGRDVLAGRAAAAGDEGCGAGDFLGTFFPTTVAARFQSSPWLCPASLIPTTAPHFEQKAWPAATAAPHF